MNHESKLCDLLLRRQIAWRHAECWLVCRLRQRAWLATPTGSYTIVVDFLIGGLCGVHYC